MVEIEKIKDEQGYTFKIITEDGTFKILFGGNLDLYWSYYGEDIAEIDQKSFRISEENRCFYNLIDRLYHQIKEYDVSYGEDKDEEYQERLKEMDIHNPHKLFQDDKVEWHSDDYVYEEAAILEIEAVDGEYLITFHKGKVEYDNEVFSIRICNSGSRYMPFNVLFMKMYHELINYSEELNEENDEYHQITIDEYLEELKRVRKKD